MSKIDTRDFSEIPTAEKRKRVVEILYFAVSNLGDSLSEEERQALYESAKAIEAKTR